MDKETVEFLLRKGADITRYKVITELLIERLQKAETIDEFKKILPDVLELEEELWKSAPHI